MRLVCPGCGAIASLEAWSADVEAREAMVALLTLPPEITPRIARYLGWFRPPGAALTWRRARELAEEIRAMVAAGVVQGKGGARACSPKTWAAAMATMEGQADKIERPLRSHGYLIAVAWELAEHEAATAEKRQEAQAARRMAPPPVTSMAGAPEPKPEPLPPPTEEEIAEAWKLVPDNCTDKALRESLHRIGITRLVTQRVERERHA